MASRAATTDMSLLTCDPEMTSAVQGVFNFLTAYAERPNYEPLLVAPIDLAEKCLRMIEREAEHARAGRPARIIAKMNALLDKAIIQALYEASQAGVEIDLIVRGMCALRPGIRGVSQRIRVRSIVGRFLEHSRVFYFERNHVSYPWRHAAAASETGTQCLPVGQRQGTHFEAKRQVRSFAWPPTSDKIGRGTTRV